METIKRDSRGNKLNRRLSKSWRKPEPPSRNCTDWHTRITTPYKRFTIRWSEDKNKYNGECMLKCNNSIRGFFESVDLAKDFVLLELLKHPTIEDLDYLYFHVENI